MAAKRDPQILCKGCDQHMGRLEWMSKKTCDNPNCKCPEVQKLIQQTNAVITKAQQSSYNVISINRGGVPHGYDATVDQVVINVPDVKVITITQVRESRKNK